MKGHYYFYYNFFTRKKKKLSTVFPFIRLIMKENSMSHAPNAIITETPSQEMDALRQTIVHSVQNGLEAMQHQIETQFNKINLECIEPSQQFLRDYCEKYKEIEKQNETLHNQIAELNLYVKLLNGKLNEQSQELEDFSRVSIVTKCERKAAALQHENTKLLQICATLKKSNAQLQKDNTQLNWTIEHPPPTASFNNDEPATQDIVATTETPPVVACETLPHSIIITSLELPSPDNDTTTTDPPRIEPTILSIVHENNRRVPPDVAVTETPDTTSCTVSDMQDVTTDTATTEIQEAPVSPVSDMHDTTPYTVSDMQAVTTGTVATSETHDVQVSPASDMHDATTETAETHETHETQTLKKNKRENATCLKNQGFKPKTLKGVQYWFKDLILYKKKEDNSCGERMGEKLTSGYQMDSISSTY
jgi:hypothetical protein